MFDISDWIYIDRYQNDTKNYKTNCLKSDWYGCLTDTARYQTLNAKYPDWHC